MATLLATTTGNFTTAGNWSLCDNTSELDSEANTVALSTSNTDSAAFTPGAITVAGVCVKLNSRAASPSGTITVTLRNSTAGTDVASVTINVSDLPTNASDSSNNAVSNGWVYFKFGSSQLLLAATNYLVRAVTSVNSQVTLYRNSTSANLSRQLVTTTTQAPAAGDKLLITGAWTAAATVAAVTITMDNTASTVFGTEALTQSLVISNNGTLTWGTSASTAYLLTIAGIVMICRGGTYNQGTSGTPIPSTSTAILNFSVTTNIASGLRNHGGVLNAYGTAPTTLFTTLTATANSAQADIVCAAVTGWANNDNLFLTPTTRTTSQFEQKIISSIASLTVTLTTNLSNAHTGGASPPRGHVGNLTRNVKIKGTANSTRAYIYTSQPGVTTLSGVEMQFLGSQGTYPRNGYMHDCLTGNSGATSVIDGCSFWNIGTVSVSSANWTNFTFTNNVIYLADTNALRLNTAPLNSTWTVTGNLICNSTNSNCMQLASLTGTISNNICSGGSEVGIDVNAIATAGGGTFSGNECYSNSQYGIRYGQSGTQPPALQTLTNSVVWRNGTGSHAGLFMQNTIVNVIVDGITAFGNAGQNILLNNLTDKVTIKSAVLNSDASFTTTYGINIGPNGGFCRVYLMNSSFSATTAHTNDLGWTNTCAFEVIAEDCTFGAASPFSTFNINSYNQPTLNSYIRVSRYGGTATDHRYFTGLGTGRSDTVIFNTATPSERMTPTNATLKFNSSPKIKVAASGETITANVYVRKSVVADAGGADYNGNQPRLIMKANAAVGIDADVVLDTMTVAIGNWEELTGTTASLNTDGALEFYVDCDGTAGWINVDDWSFSTA